jgi:hypothetical protein
MCLAAAGQTAASLDRKRNPVLAHGPALRTEKGNYSFRGLRVPVGAKSAAMEIPITNGGDVPLTGVNAVTHGDFVVTGTSCSATLPAGAAEKSRCVVSVAFQPTASGPRTGDLTVAANGADSMVVPLDAGTPIDFGSVRFGETSVLWLWLYPIGPLTGSVTGPFEMALQAPYMYGSIDGIDFGTSSSGTPSGGSLGLGVQFQASAYGTQTGTITLSDGSTYDLTASVADLDGVQLSPTSVDFQNVPYKSGSGTAPFILTNGSNADLTIRSVQATAPFTSTNDCGPTIAAGASCTVDVTYDTRVAGAATGQLTIATSSGSFVSSLAGNVGANIENADVDPINIFPVFTHIGELSPPQTITVKNNGGSSLNVVGFDGINICSATLTSNCYQITSSNCSTLAPLASCQIQIQYLFGAPSGNTISNINLELDRGNSRADYMIWSHQVAPTSNSSDSLVAIPGSLNFPSTAIGQASDEQLVTIVNNSNQPYFVVTGASYEFSANSGCAIVAPGDICLVHVRFIPVGAGLLDGSAGIIYGVSATPSPVTYASDGAYLHGYGIPTTTLASPAYYPLIEPVFFPQDPAPDGTYVYGALPVKNTGSAPLILANVWIANGPQQFSVDASQCGQPLPPGAECTLNLTWNPEYCPPDWYCDDSNHLSLESNAASSLDSYALLGEHFHSTNASLQLPVSTGPSAIEFGRVQIGSPATQSMSFNGGLAPIPAISLNGTDFQLVNGCESLAGTTTSCSIQVIYAPTVPGFNLGSLRLVSKAGIGTVTLAGYAIPAQLSASPASINFPDTLVYQNPPNQTVTITNTTAAPLALGAVYQPDLGFQIVTTTCGASLAAQAACAITVAFTPYNNVGQQTSSLRFSFGIDDGVETIPINAPVTSLTVTPASTSFGSITIGQVGAQIFTVQNIDAGKLYPAALQGAALSGTDAADFTITANTCTAGATLTVAQTCSVTVQFKPAASGIRNAVLTIATSNAGYTSAILAGTGNAPSPSCGERHLHHHDKDEDGERDCDCDKHDHRDRHDCQTKEHRDNDHEQREK